MGCSRPLPYLDTKPQPARRGRTSPRVGYVTVRERKSPLRRRALPALAAAAFAWAAPAHAAPADVARSAAEGREYWTPERMESAIPLGPTGAADSAKGGRIAKRVR